MLVHRHISLLVILEPSGSSVLEIIRATCLKWSIHLIAMIMARDSKAKKARSSKGQDGGLKQHFRVHTKSSPTKRGKAGGDDDGRWCLSSSSRDSILT